MLQYAVILTAHGHLAWSPRDTHQSLFCLFCSFLFFLLQDRHAPEHLSQHGLHSVPCFVFKPVAAAFFLYQQLGYSGLLLSSLNKAKSCCKLYDCSKTVEWLYTACSEYESMARLTWLNNLLDSCSGAILSQPILLYALTRECWCWQWAIFRNRNTIFYFQTVINVLLHAWKRGGDFIFLLWYQRLIHDYIDFIYIYSFHWEKDAFHFG